MTQTWTAVAITNTGMEYAISSQRRTLWLPEALRSHQKYSNGILNKSQAIITQQAKEADAPQAKFKPENTNENSIAFPKQITGSSQGEDKKTAKAEHRKGIMYACESVTIETEALKHPPINSETESLDTQERKAPANKPNVQENARINVDLLRKQDIHMPRKKQIHLTPTPHLLCSKNSL